MRSLFLFIPLVGMSCTCMGQSDINQTWTTSILVWESELKEIQGLEAQSGQVAPILLVTQRQGIKLSKRWKFGIDLRFQKNTRPYISHRPEGYETFHTAIPIYLSLYCNKVFSIDSGFYVGTFLNGRNLPEYIPLDLRAWRYLNMEFDGGFIAGVGYTIHRVGKLVVRYNYGMRKIVPISKDQLATNQMLEVGLTISI